MNDYEFFLTRIGRTYYEVTLPSLIQQISRLNDLLALHLELVGHNRETPKPKGGCDGCAKKD